MNNLEQDIKKAEIQMLRFADMLNNSNEINTDRMANVTRLFDEMGKLRSDMLSQYPRQELQKFNKNFAILVKQIQSKLDNIIRIKEVEKKAVSQDLQKLNTKKKLSIYNR